MAKMYTFNVRVPGGEYEEVTAHDVVLADGMLVFKRDGNLVIAYAPGQWELVVEGG